MNRTESQRDKFHIRISSALVTDDLVETAGKWSDTLPEGKKFIARQLETGEVILEPTNWFKYAIWTFVMSLRK